MYVSFNREEENNEQTEVKAINLNNTHGSNLNYLVSQILSTSGFQGSIEREFAYCFLIFVSQIEKSASIEESINVRLINILIS